MQTLSATTELDAVNIMLSTIGESPVNSLAADQSTVDVGLARQILREITIAVQTPGWQFNTEVGWVLSPTVDGELLIPANCVQIDTSGSSASVDVAQRGNRLYNRTTHSFVFTSTVTVDMIILLPFDDCPQAARHYIAIRAARVFQKRMVGSGALDAFTREDENQARVSLRRLDTTNADANFLNGSWSVARVLSR